MVTAVPAHYVSAPVHGSPVENLGFYGEQRSRDRIVVGYNWKKSKNETEGCIPYSLSGYASIGYTFCRRQGIIYPSHGGGCSPR